MATKMGLKVYDVSVVDDFVVVNSLFLLVIFTILNFVNPSCMKEYGLRSSSMVKNV